MKIRTGSPAERLGAAVGVLTIVGGLALVNSTPIIEGTAVAGPSVVWADSPDAVGYPAPSGHGCGEDFHIPDAAATIRLYVTGEFTGDMVPQLGEEDGPLVDYILSLREQQ